MNQYLLVNEYQRLKSNANIYLRRENAHGFTTNTIYVDDCILLSKKISLTQQVKAILQTKFEMSDEGDLHYTLSNAIRRNQQESWTSIHQQQYLTSKLKENDILNCNS